MGWINDAIVKFKCFVINRRENSDKEVVKRIFRERMGYELDLKHPQTFNEKLQWLKLYDRKPIYTKMVDKVEAKKFVAKKIGEEYVIPTLGVWKNFDDIDFDSLPDQFVLKCSHDSGGLVICRDKSKFDHAAAKEKLEKSLRYNYYLHTREWPYKNVKPRILAEAYLDDAGKTSLTDYKFFCFHGVPTYCQVITDRATDERIDFFDMDWKHQEFIGLSVFKNADSEPPIPVCFDKMKRASQLLAKNIAFLRVDFYEVNSKLYFGELTFFPASGFGKFVPAEWNKTVGSWITLPKKNLWRYLLS